jgi:TRAP transporter TAXI family solute receptor
MTSKLFSMPSMVLALGMCLVACGSTSQPRFLSIATGGSGGVYFPYGGALAKLISEQVPGVQATAEVTNASVDNLKLMQLGKVDLAFTLADTVAEAVRGRGPFKETGAIGSIRTVAVLYTNYTHVVVKADSGIKTVADLRRKTVSVGAPGSGTELLADRVLAAAKLDPRTDIVRHTLSVAESAGALKDGKLDAFFWSGGVPTPAIQDLAATPGLKVVLLPQDDLVLFMQRDYGNLYRLAMIPGGVYRGLDREIPTVGVTNLLVASSASTRRWCTKSRV